MAKGIKMRVEIPKNPKELLDLSIKVSAKHTADAAASPLNLLQDIDIAVESSKAAAALLKHNEAEDLRLQMEKAYKDRDFLMSNTATFVKNSRDLLTGMHRENMKRLGDWGFTVDHSAKAKKAVVPPATPPANP